MKSRSVAIIVAAILVPVLAIGGIVFGLLAIIGGQAASANAGGGACTVGDAGTALTVTTSGGDSVQLDEKQLANAAKIITVGTQAGVSVAGLKIALMTTLQESKLRMLANSTVPESLEFPHEGVGSDHDSVNFFQQRPGGWGTVAELMDPDYAIRAFFGGPKGPNGGSPRGLLDIKDWETLRPGQAAQKVQVSGYPDAYDQWEGAAETIINSMSGSIVCDGGGISADAQQLAQGLVTAIDSGRLTVFGSHEQQIRDMAAGTATEQCQLDVGVLQIIVFALQHFETLKISSLNRRCTSETPGAGTRSYHWKGQAVDFSVIDGNVTTGWDANSLKLTQLLDPYMPAGLAGVGQSDCRADHGVSLMLSNFIQFADGCNHLHVEIRQPDTPLNFPPS
ncbi:hypothetical protein [Corynebacterium doosanense]|uniref:Peptidase M23 n=1 Tax=Corynebacterium doosanense CAU 212 = DSM 45436 TaxID=558173 RepID=A0A097ID32_9CORY|nr:hypothetical protein [Corynebacterium doosanense]AIT60034.1 peptidase M23 [Corynebacterium doosanense CAU 212 = DSM 45436]